MVGDSIMSPANQSNPLCICQKCGTAACLEKEYRAASPLLECSCYISLSMVSSKLCLRLRDWGVPKILQSECRIWIWVSSGTVVLENMVKSGISCCPRTPCWLPSLMGCISEMANSSACQCRSDSVPCCDQQLRTRFHSSPTPICSLLTSASMSLIPTIVSKSWV